MYKGAARFVSRDSVGVRLGREKPRHPAERIAVKRKDASVEYVQASYNRIRTLVWRGYAEWCARGRKQLRREFEELQTFRARVLTAARATGSFRFYPGRWNTDRPHLDRVIAEIAKLQAQRASEHRSARKKRMEERRATARRCVAESAPNGSGTDAASQSTTNGRTVAPTRV